MAASGAVITPFAESFSEWRVKLNGAIATCVEASAIVIEHIMIGTGLSPQTDIAFTRQLQARGQASASGATNWAAASEQLARDGVPNKAYGPDYFRTHSLTDLLNSRAGRVPVLVGLHNAQALVDDWTGQHYNRGVFGHGITVVGYDSSGYITADPNTPQAQQGQFVHYTPQNLLAAGADSLVIPTGQPGGLPGVVASAANTVTSAPGFAPIAQALDDAEQFTDFDMAAPLVSVWGNVSPFLIRMGIATLGFIIIIGIIFWLLKQTAPVVERNVAQVGELAALVGAV